MNHDARDCLPFRRWLIHTANLIYFLKEHICDKDESSKKTSYKIINYKSKEENKVQYYVYQKEKKTKYYEILYNIDILVYVHTSKALTLSLKKTMTDKITTI